MNILLTYSYTYLHFVVSDERIRQKEVFSQRASEENTGILAMTHLNAWLVIAFISSTASCVIGYNAQCCKNASVYGSAPASEHLNLAADDMTHWTI